jgi:hypothetical protein
MTIANLSLQLEEAYKVANAVGFGLETEVTDMTNITLLQLHDDRAALSSLDMPDLLFEVSS